MTKDDLREYVHEQIRTADSKTYIAKSRQIARDLDASANEVGRAIQELRTDDDCDIEIEKWGSRYSSWVFALPESD